MAHKGCDYSNGLFLYPICHEGVPMFLQLLGTELIVTCAICGKLVNKLLLDKEFVERDTPKCDCDGNH